MSTPSARLLLLRLERLFPVAPYHDDGEEASNDRGAEDNQDDGDANGPDARGEEGVERMVLVDEGHQQGPDGVVEEDGGCCNEHAEAHETVKHFEVT